MVPTNRTVVSGVDNLPYGAGGIEGSSLGDS